MKTSVKKILFVEAIIGLVAILNFFFPFIFNNNKQLILLTLSMIVLNAFVGINIKRMSNDRVIIRNILIYIFLYYLIIYLLGLVVGFTKSIYSFSVSNLIINIIPSILTIFGIEIVRYTMINKSNNNKIVNISTCILFIIFEVSIYFKLYDLTVKDDIYLFVGLLLSGCLTKNILMTIIDNRSDFLPSMIYRLLMETMQYVLLIEPDLGPYLKSVLVILFPVLVGIMIINSEKIQIKDKPKKEKKGKRLYWVIVAVLAILVLLNSGLLKYQIMVIGSNSMKNYMSKGDVIFVERLRNNNRNDVQIGEILVYRYDNKIISHRVSDRLERKEDVFYKTKGDNNDQEDGIVIDKSKVLGKVLFRIKYIGLPSVWLSDLFN